MTDENKFCTACGAMLPEVAEFCPECGAGIGGRANPHAFAQGPGYGMQQRSGPPTVSILILIYGLLAAVLGISAIYLGLTFTEADFQELIDQYAAVGMVLPFEWSDSFNSEVLFSGGISLVSAVGALVSYWFCYKRGPKTYAVIACAVSTVFSFGMASFVSVIIGAIVTFLLYRDDKGFTS